MIPRPPPDPLRESLYAMERWRQKLTAAKYRVIGEPFDYAPVAPDPRTRGAKR